MAGGLKEINLETFKPFMGEEAKEKAVEENFKSLRTFLGRTGASTLVNIAQRKLSTLSNTTEQTLSGFSAAFQTTGGLVDIAFRTNFGNNQALRQNLFALYLDDKVVDSVTLGGTAIGVLVPVSLWHSEVLGSGIHKVKVTSLVSAGTYDVGFGLGGQPSFTKLLVKEILL